MTKGMRSNLHTHTYFSDGHSTPEEYIQAALKAGLNSIGFSDHSYAPFDTGHPMKSDAMPEYLSVLGALKEKYKEQIEVYIGLEGEGLCMPSRDGLDYLIGGVHFFKDEATGRYYSDDDGPGCLELICRETGVSIRDIVEAYYKSVANTALIYKPDIIAHLDLVVKFNEGGRLFDTSSDWYIDAAFAAVEAIKKSGCILEMNTGGITKGLTTHPYPQNHILKRVFEVGIPMTISSDCHRYENLTAGFDLSAELLREVGYKSIFVLLGGKFAEVEL